MATMDPKPKVMCGENYLLVHQARKSMPGPRGSLPLVGHQFCPHGSF